MDEEIFQDAIETIEKSDQMITFDEWADGWIDEMDYDELMQIWNMACDESDCPSLKEENNDLCENKRQIRLSENQLRQYISECVEETLLEEGLFGGRLSNAFNQHMNSLKSGYYDQRATNMSKQIQQQIAQSQQIIKQEQEKINNLRYKYNNFVRKSQGALKDANKYAAANGKSGQNGNFYQNTSQNMVDNNTQDFYNQQEIDKAFNSGQSSAYGKMGNKIKNKKP